MDNETAETEIENALNHYPLAFLPPGFVNQVMARVNEFTAVPIRFRLEFLDWVIPLFVGVFALVLMSMISLGGAAASSESTLTLPQLPGPNWLALIGLVVLAEIIIAGLFAVWLWSDNPPFANES